MGKTKIVLQVRAHREVYTFQLSEYLKKNWGSPFIVTFMILILSAAGYLSYGLENVANELAIYAYYSLVLGVMLQTVSYMKRSREERSEK